MKKIISVLTILVLVLTLSACSVYSSSYKAFILVTNYTNKKAHMTFNSFEGRRVFKLKCKNEKELSYSLSLETGEAKVYIDNGEGKVELLSISSGEEKSGSLNDIKSGTIYIIFETNGKCLNGLVDFKLL